MLIYITYVYIEKFILYKIYMNMYMDGSMDGWADFLSSFDFIVLFCLFF